MRKGFLHMVEVVIVGMMVFLVTAQFSNTPKQSVDWVSTKLSIQANDILFSLDRRGVDWFNPAEVNQSVYSFVSSNTIYSLKVKNAMKSQIKIGCICSPAEKTALEGSLQPFEINGRKINFIVTRIDPASMAFSHDYDVIVVFDYSLGNYYTQVRQFLGADKGIVEFRHLDQSGMDGVQKDFFGLKWNSSLFPLTPYSVRFRSNESSESYYNIYKYFHSIPIYQENFTSGAPGWSSSGGTWTANGGTYNGNSASPSISLYSFPFYDTYSFSVSFMPDAGYSRNVTLILHWRNQQNNVFVNFDVSADTVTVWENISGSAFSRGSSSYAIGPGIWYDVKIIPQVNRRLKIYINGSSQLFSFPLSDIPLSSQIGLGVENGQARFDNVRVTFSDKHNFNQILQNEKIQQADNDTQKIILLQNSSLPACIVNSHIVEDRGRTAWFAYADLAANQDTRNMLRTLVVWAAGDEDDIIRNEVKNIPVVTSLYKTYDQDMYQPVEVVLTMGSLYG